MPARLSHLLRWWTTLYTQRIWQAALDDDRSARGRCYSFLRILSITLTGLQEIKLFSRAASLSYSSLLGIGPLIAIAMLIAGTLLNNTDPTFVVEKLTEALHFIAPQIDQLAKSDAAAGDAVRVGVNQALSDLLNRFIAGSRSSALTSTGVLILVVIVVQLFISVEESFNAIWGTRRGRSLFMRIVVYWTAVTLGAVLILTALTLLSAKKIAEYFPYVPWADKLQAALGFSAPLIAFALLVTLLTCFYRFIPNTNVRWSPCLVGAVVVAVLLFANNYLAVVFFQSALRTESFFGPLSILPVLMAAFYIFWFFVLLGGQITYAVQNVHYHSSRVAWDELNHHSRESLSLLVLILIARRFQLSQAPLTASGLSSSIRVPTQLINESLNRLVDLQLISITPPGPNESSLDNHFQPARPPNRIALSTFRESFARLGSAPSGEELDTLDPVLRHFHERLAQAHGEAFGAKTLEQLIEELPDPTRPASPP